MFIGRTNELRRIKRRLSLDSFQAVMVYGRRRIGKTELVREAIKESDKPSLELIARNTNPSLNLSDFAKQAGQFMDAMSFHPQSFYELFTSLMNYSKDHPFILFIDEFSFLMSGEEDIDASLQKAIEQYKDTAKMTLILCGSYIDIMSKLIESDSPLYGRFNEVILLRTFDYKDSSLFYPQLSNEEKVQYYSVFGGTAFNIKNIDYSLPFEVKLINDFISFDSFFEKEALATIQNETIKDANANAILELIASGTRKFKELNSRLGDPSKDNIGRYIRKLEELDLIGKSFMVNDKFEKKPLYYIKDNLLDFYYTYLFRRINIRETIDPKVFFENFIKEDFYTKYLPRKFEEIIREYVFKENGKRIPLFTSAGRLYFNKKVNKEIVNREFDLVIETKDGYLPIECKYKDTPVTLLEVTEEMKQWNGLPFKIVRYGFASKSGFTDEVKARKDLLLINLSDIYQ